MVYRNVTCGVRGYLTQLTIHIGALGGELMGYIIDTADGALWGIHFGDGGIYLIWLRVRMCRRGFAWGVLGCGTGASMGNTW